MYIYNINRLVSVDVIVVTFNVASFLASWRRRVSCHRRVWTMSFNCKKSVSNILNKSLRTPYGRYWYHQQSLRFILHINKKLRALVGKIGIDKRILVLPTMQSRVRSDIHEYKGKPNVA